MLVFSHCVFKRTNMTDEHNVNVLFFRCRGLFNLWLNFGSRFGGWHKGIILIIPYGIIFIFWSGSRGIGIGVICDI